MTDRIKHRFQGSLREWLRLLVEMKLISEQDSAGAAERAAPNSEIQDRNVA